MSSDATGALLAIAEPDLTGHEAAYLAECVASGFVSSVGPFVERFERAIAAATGAPACAAVQSGSAALYLALRALGVGPGDLVIMPSYTFIASANAVRLVGAQPWILDVEPEGWSLDPGLLRTSLERETSVRHGRLTHIETGARVAAVMPVYALGATPLVEAVAEVSHGFGLPVLGDAAGAIGARHGRGAASVPLAATADLLCLSFNGNKTITCGGGGAVIGRDATLVNRCRHLAAQARTGSGYDHDDAGFNFRMTNLQAAVGCAQAERLDAFLAVKRRVRAAYDAAIAALPWMAAFPSPPWSESACWMSGVLLPRGGDHDGFMAHLRGRGVGARRFWKPLHLQAPYAAAPRTLTDVCDGFWERVVTLPCSVSLDDGAIARVSDAIRGAATIPGRRAA